MAVSNVVCAGDSFIASDMVGVREVRVAVSNRVARALVRMLIPFNGPAFSL